MKIIARIILFFYTLLSVGSASATLPYTFATMPAGNVAASNLDANFAYLENGQNISLSNYSPKGDCSSDDTAKIQAAITAASGVRLEISPAQAGACYCITTGLTGISNSLIHGNGPNSAIKNCNTNPSADIDILTFTNQSNFKVDSLYLIGSAASKNISLNAPGGGGSGIVIHNSSNFETTHNDVEYMLVDGIVGYSDGTTGASVNTGKINGNYFNNNSYYKTTFVGAISGVALTVTSVSQGAVVQDQVLSGTGLTLGTAVSGVAATSVYPSQNVASETITGYTPGLGGADIELSNANTSTAGYIYGMEIASNFALSTNGIGIFLGESPSAVGGIYDVDVHDNLVANKLQQGIVGSYANTADTAFTIASDFHDNIIRDTNWMSMYFNGPVQDIGVRNNKLTSCNKLVPLISTLPWGCIGATTNGSSSTDVSSTLSVIGNTIFSYHGWSGINIEYGSNDLVSFNMIKGDGTTRIGEPLVGNIEAAISVHNLSNSLLDNNVISFSGLEGTGILLSSFGTTLGTENTTASNNSIVNIGTGLNDIWLNGGAYTTGNIVKNNTLISSSAPNVGIFPDTGTTYNTIESNHLEYSGVVYAGARIYDLGTGSRVSDNYISTDPLVSTFTCGAAAFGTVSNGNSKNSSGHVVFWPENASAATLMSGANALYIANGNGVAGVNFQWNTAGGGNAAGTEVFGYRIIN